MLHLPLYTRSATGTRMKAVKQIGVVVLSFACGDGLAHRDPLFLVRGGILKASRNRTRERNKALIIP
jgi:hypothetical protein